MRISPPLVFLSLPLLNYFYLRWGQGFPPLDSDECNLTASLLKLLKSNDLQCLYIRVGYSAAFWQTAHISERHRTQKHCNILVRELRRKNSAEPNMKRVQSSISSYFTGPNNKTTKLMHRMHVSTLNGLLFIGVNGPDGGILSCAR